MAKPLKFESIKAVKTTLDTLKFEVEMTNRKELKRLIKQINSVGSIKIQGWILMTSTYRQSFSREYSDSGLDYSQINSELRINSDHSESRETLLAFMSVRSL